MPFPTTTHQAANEGWRIRVVCRCGRTGFVSHAALTSRPDVRIDEANFLCRRAGCAWGVNVEFWPPDYRPPTTVTLPEMDRFARVPNEKKISAMLAGILSPQAIAQVEQELLLARQKRKPSLAWERAP